MNPLVKKEIRLLFPAWVAAMLLASAPVWLAYLPEQLLRTFGEDALVTITGFFFLLGILLLGIAPFGQEFSFKTFPLLLSQPAERCRVWRAKISLQAVAFTSILLVAALSWAIFYFKHPAQAPDRASVSLPALIGAVVFFSGGLWTTLLFRQVTAGFWFTFLVPGAIVISAGNLSEHFQWSDRTLDVVMTVVLGLYSIGGFFWARRLFFRAQDAQWTGGNIFFPWRKRFSDHTSAMVPGGLRGRYVALAWKEIQLHEASLFIAVIIFALNVIAIPIHTITSNPDLKMVCELVWSLWLLMPLLVGAAAVAEERRVGTLEQQLCLPVSRNVQFSMKFFIGLILSLILGGVMPSLTGWKFGAAHEFSFWGGIVAATYFVSFYASTLARSTLQAIGMAIGIPVWLTAFGLLFFQYNDRLGHNNAGWVALAAIIGVPSLLLVMARLMFWNFRWLHRDWKMWWRNAAVITGFFVAVFILANAIFYRTWEFLTPADYPHGPARLSNAKSVKVFSWGGVISAILPDGRLWSETLAYNHFPIFDYWPIAPDRTKARFATGSNWTDLTMNGHEMLAVKSDGTLWCALNLWQPPGDWTQTAFTRIDSETNWLRVAAATRSWNGFLLLKTDGSLWIWATNRNPNIYRTQSLDLKTPPARISDDTNWTELRTSADFPFAKKRDGSIWSLQQTSRGTNAIWSLEQETNLDIDWFGYYPYGVEIKTNGELWVASRINWMVAAEIPAIKAQLGRGMKWKAATLTGYETALIALRDDGTLWKSSPLKLLETGPEKIQFTPLGNHSDWIALPGLYGMALAADGSLWSWGEFGRLPFLAPSRKPVYLGNIFTVQ